jgi:lysozyme
MKTSSRGLDLIKQFEGFEPKAYVCPAGVLTIGYGSTGKHVARGQTITRDEATALLAKDVVRFEKAVNKLGVKLTQNQFDALVAFVYNVGEGNFATSTLARRLKAGDMAGAAAQFAVWNKARVKGVLTVLNGLTRRRAAEAALFAGL